MQYIGIKEAEELWGVRERSVQTYCKEGRIAGVIKYQDVWLIPEGSEKPIDLRREKRLNEEHQSPYIESGVMCAIESILKYDDSPDNPIWKTENAYFKGEYEAAKQYFDHIPNDDPNKICSATLAMGSAIITNDYLVFKRVENFLYDCMGPEKPIQTKRLAEMVHAIMMINMREPNLIPNWLKEADFCVLPKNSWPFLQYVYCRYLYGTRQFEKLADFTERCIEPVEAGGKITLYEIYIRVLNAQGNMPLGRIDKAERQLKDALCIGLPHNIILPFVEAINPLGGLPEKIIKAEHPEYYDLFMKQRKMLKENSAKIQKEFKIDNLKLILTQQEYETARLLADKKTYQDIADELNLSLGRINNIVLSLYEKLGINKKTQIKQFLT